MDSDLQVLPCLDWRTELPISSAPRDSPAFSLQGSAWRLRIACGSGALIRHSGYRLHLVPEEEGDLPAPFGVATYARHPTADDSGIPERWTWREVQRRERVVLWETGGDSEGSAEMRFVCTFYGARPSQIGGRTGPDNLLPEVNQKSTLATADKCVQVSSVVPRDIESLSSDLSRLLEKEVLPDVRLECGGRTFRAHRSVLAARSDVFRAMFQNETSESQTGDVKIQDMDVGVLQELLKFLYSGRPEDISEDNVSQLYEASDKYAVMSLKAACAYWIERHLAVENCVRYLVLADSHSDRDLKAAVVSFILKNPGVLKSEEWLTLRPSELAIEVMQTYIASTIP